MPYKTFVRIKIYSWAVSNLTFVLLSFTILNLTIGFFEDIAPARLNGWKDISTRNKYVFPNCTNCLDYPLLPNGNIPPYL